MYSTLTRKIQLNMVHPVKELIFVYTDNRDTEVNSLTGNNQFAYSVQEHRRSDVVDECQLMFLGTERFSARPGSYFRTVQPYNHHTRIPDKNIYCYSFSLFPEQSQPSGAANFSKLDSVSLNLKFADFAQNGTLQITGVSYNILRIQNGMAGLAFPS